MPLGVSHLRKIPRNETNQPTSKRLCTRTQPETELSPTQDPQTREGQGEGWAWGWPAGDPTIDLRHPGTQPGALHLGEDSGPSLEGQAHQHAEYQGPDSTDPKQAGFASSPQGKDRAGCMQPPPPTIKESLVRLRPSSRRGEPKKRSRQETKTLGR